MMGGGGGGGGRGGRNNLLYYFYPHDLKLKLSQQATKVVKLFLFPVR